MVSCLRDAVEATVGQKGDDIGVPEKVVLRKPVHHLDIVADFSRLDMRRLPQHVGIEFTEGFGESVNLLLGQNSLGAEGHNERTPTLRATRPDKLINVGRKRFGGSCQNRANQLNGRRDCSRELDAPRRLHNHHASVGHRLGMGPRKVVFRSQLSRQPICHKSLNQLVNEPYDGVVHPIADVGDPRQPRPQLWDGVHWRHGSEPRKEERVGKRDRQKVHSNRDLEVVAHHRAAPRCRVDDDDVGVPDLLDHSSVGQQAVAPTCVHLGKLGAAGKRIELRYFLPEFGILFRRPRVIIGMICDIGVVHSCVQVSVGEVCIDDHHCVSP
mmetsp:Transcript_20925/g.54401  ORF Transcript_20925/g.54401 Transcript_20925/m.54401 type:complete len:326 (+) Transcript_20925:470-1447(+)